MAAKRVMLVAWILGLLATAHTQAGSTSSSSNISWKWTTWTPEYGVTPLRWGTSSRGDAPAYVLRDAAPAAIPAPVVTPVVAPQPVAVNNAWVTAPVSVPPPPLTMNLPPVTQPQVSIPPAVSASPLPVSLAPVAQPPASTAATLPQSAAWTIRPEAAATLTSPFAFDAFVNMGNGPYAQEYPLTVGGGQPWYTSPIVQHVYGGMPTPEQQQQFTRDVLNQVKSDYQRSGLSVSLTNNPNDSSAHTLSVVSGTQSPANPAAIGITDIGRNGFTFIDKFSYANTPAELETAVANNIAHELMHAFGLDRHDPTGGFIDSAVTDWSVLINPNASFSEQAASRLAAIDFKQVGLPGSIGAQEMQGDATTVVPEPGTYLLWGLGCVGAVVWNRRRRRAA